MQNKKWQIVVLAVLVLIAVCMGVFWWTRQQAAPVAPPVRPIQKTANAALPTETAKPTPKFNADSGVAVPPITEINPRTVYSGNLGTLTGIQAGADIKKMELEFAQLDAKIKDIQKKEEVAPLALPPLSQSSGTPALPEKKESSRIVVMAVRGMDGVLSATLRTKNGTHIVRAGETVPGFGKVQSISRDRVVVNGSAVPWM